MWSAPKQFDKKEWDIRVVIPNYSCIPEKYRNKFEYVTHFIWAQVLTFQANMWVF